MPESWLPGITISVSFLALTEAGNCDIHSDNDWKIMYLTKIRLIKNIDCQTTYHLEGCTKTRMGHVTSEIMIKLFVHFLPSAYFSVNLTDMLKKVSVVVVHYKNCGPLANVLVTFTQSYSDNTPCILDVTERA